MENEAQGNGNDAVLRALFSELDKLGIEEFCIAAGARNAPIIAELMERGRYQVRHFLDERSAGFFALGRIMADCRPVAVVTTSGTAAGELLPSMMEAYYQGLRLVAITADRPARYRLSGAPQAVEQEGIFGPYAPLRWEGKWIWDEVEHTNLHHALNQPVHFNVCLEEGPSKTTPVVSASQSAGSGSNQVQVVRAKENEMVGPSEKCDADLFWEKKGGLVVLVAGLQPLREVTLVRDFLLKLGAPVVAEATSNLRQDERLRGLLISGGEKALQEMAAKRVLRIGAVPSWRWWRDLEEKEEVHVLSVSDTSFRGLARTRNVALASMADLMNFEVKSGTQEMAVLEERGAKISARLDGLIEDHPHSEPAWVRHLSQIIPTGASVFLGNSLPIREWNLAAVRPKPGTRFFANRGANGIDGLISTGFGVGAEAKEGWAEVEETWIIVGDLSALYDMNAPWILPQLKNQRWRIVVINNGGGKIFSRVAWLRGLPEAVQSMVENRHTLHFEHWAKQWNLEYRRFEKAEDLRDDDAACAVWEIIPDAEQTEAFWKEWK